MATIQVERNHTGGLLLLFVVAALVALAFFSLSAVPRPAQPPAVEDIITRPHAVEQHGSDALAARVSLTVCDQISSRWLGNGWAVWCETGDFLCPGCYITAGGIEKTALVRPCWQWRGWKGKVSQW